MFQYIGDGCIVVATVLSPEKKKKVNETVCSVNFTYLLLPACFAFSRACFFSNIEDKGPSRAVHLPLFEPVACWCKSTDTH